MIKVPLPTIALETKEQNIDNIRLCKWSNVDKGDWYKLATNIANKVRKITSPAWKKNGNKGAKNYTMARRNPNMSHRQ